MVDDRQFLRRSKYAELNAWPRPQMTRIGVNLLGAGLVPGADQRERGKNHQGRWRPQGPLNGLLVRPVLPPVGTHRRAELGWCPAHQNMRRSFQLVWRASRTVARPPDTQPTHRLRLRGTSVPESGSTGEVTRTEAAPGRPGKTATAGEVSAITKE